MVVSYKVVLRRAYDAESYGICKVEVVRRKGTDRRDRKRGGQLQEPENEGDASGRFVRRPAPAAAGGKLVRLRLA